MSEHKPLAPGTIVFHPARGYGVLTGVNLLTGWISARFGNEVNTLDLSLSTTAFRTRTARRSCFAARRPTTCRMRA